MNNNSIGLRPIKEIIRENFLIPSYQRGYRWTSKQVKELLDDIWEFALKKTWAHNEFYCLQPVVVRQEKNGGRWEVVDGQQRLTTIYLLLTYRDRVFHTNTNMLTIEYVSRPGSAAFLRDINKDETQKRKEENIDYYYICEALNTIHSWFEEHDDLLDAVSQFFPILLNHTQIIWYEVTDADPRAIFTRLNMGKIPLTSAELIKALFLKGENFTTENVPDSKRVQLNQLEIASEWDRIEYALQNDAFWYFLTDHEPPRESRIGFLLDLIAGKTSRHDDYHSFRHFYDRFNEDHNNESPAAQVVALWQEVKQFYATLDEWFTDEKLYHPVGYLLTVKANNKKIAKRHDIRSLQIKAGSTTKSGFREYLRQQISQYVEGDVDSLSYEDSNKVRQVLLLFNIQTLINNQASGTRFRFDKYKMEKWDIEHIHAVKSRMPETTNHQKEWLAVVLEEAGHELDNSWRQRAIHFIENNGKEGSDTFENLFTEVLNRYSEEGSTGGIDEIGNLTLLDATTNRSYKNAIFPIKRKQIISRDEQGTFIPLCTKNVFLKHYTEDPEQLTLWSAADRNAYREKIIKTLTDYNVS